MRVPIFIVVLIGAAFFAGFAGAAPSIRWIDATGTVQAAVVAKTLSEDNGVAHVELADGKAIKIRFRALLEWVREDESKAEQMALLDARIRVRAGVRIKGVASVLDHLAAKGTEPWIREYASAARAILAVRERSADATKREQLFRKMYPASRFAAELILERAHAVASRAKGAEDATGTYLTAFETIQKLGGPLRVQFRCLEGCSRVNAKGGYQRSKELGSLLDTMVDKAIPEKDLVVSTVELSAESDVQLVLLDVRADNVRKAGLSLKGVTVEYRNLSVQSDLFLPATRSAPLFRIGELELESGNLDAARKQFKLARALDPSWSLRYRVEAALATAKNADKNATK